MVSVYNSGTNTVTIPVDGFYYVYISAGVQRQQQMRMSVQKNNAILFNIYHLAYSDGEESLNHGMVVSLRQGDVLKVVGDVNSYFYNTKVGYQTSFIGMLLY